MIIDVPTPDEFHTAGLNQLYLAWEIAMRAVRECNGARDASPEEADAPAEYWQRVQPALANAYALIQQGMELALKGRIAAVSPYLLLGDPGDWPKKAATEHVSFGEFKTIDAAELLKVHNSLVTAALDDNFKGFWEQVRRDRNRIMHSTSRPVFDAAAVIRTILAAAQVLYADMTWPQRLLDMEADGKFTVFGFVDDVQNNVMREIDDARTLLDPAEIKRFLGLDTRQRSYVCPVCYHRANRDWQDEWPQLAQLATKTAGETKLHCIVCDATTEVDRHDCAYARCPGNVLAEDLCLTCVRDQHLAVEIDSDLPDPDLGPAHRYEFVFGQGSQPWGGDYVSLQQRLIDDDHAKKYAAQAMAAPHLARWETVSLFHKQTGVFPLRGADDRAVGYWLRDGGHLHWYGGASAYQPERDGPV